MRKFKIIKGTTEYDLMSFQHFSMFLMDSDSI